ncbi:MAG: adenylate cyclase, partial [Bacteroidia bacterium]|nr:adenylate cyclase [Bacteroidia bacterium]
EDDPFDKPDWLGEEVTGDLKYYNSSLARRPFKVWNL